MERRQILGAIGAFAASCAVPAKLSWAQGPSILLGQSAALTGPAGELGLQFSQGAQCCFEQVNRHGGIGGRRIELRTLDDGYEPGRCIQNTRRLIDDDVFALFGYVGTATSLAAVPLATQSRKPFFAPFTGSEALRIPFNPFVFHIRASYVDETTAVVRHLLSLGIKRIGVFFQNDGEGKAGLLGVGRAMKLQYLRPTGLGKVEPNSENVGPAVHAILAEKPDAIALISTYRPCAAFIHAARQAGFSGMFCTTSSVGTQSLSRDLGKEARGVLVSQVMPYPFAVTSRVAGEYLATGRAVMGETFEPSYGGIEGYVAARTFAEALRRTANNLSPSGVMTALESLHDFDLGGFDVSFGPEKHTASRLVDLTILTEDGKIRH
jgi:branched-chain amino acid transport system substrate-binding protein